jgi:hypothetical protein
MAKRRHLELSILILAIFSTSQGCKTNVQTPRSTPTPQVLETASIATIIPAQTNTFTTTLEIFPTSTITQTPTITQTQIPLGIFPLLFYPPLVMNYDPSAWEDKSHYTDLSVMVNYLEDRKLTTCILGVVGPSGNFPTPSEIIYLGKARYQVTIYEHQIDGKIYALYLQDKLLSGYDHGIGAPVLGVAASPSEWLACKRAAEKILSTLHSPSE